MLPFLLEPQLDEKLILNFCKKSKCKTLFSDEDNILNSIRLNKNLKIKEAENLVKINENNNTFENYQNFQFFHFNFDLRNW